MSADFVRVYKFDNIKLQTKEHVVFLIVKNKCGLGLYFLIEFFDSQ